MNTLLENFRAAGFQLPHLFPLSLKTCQQFASVMAFRASTHVDKA